MMPTVRNSRVDSGMSWDVVATSWMSPIRNEPTTLTMKVP